MIYPIYICGSPVLRQETEDITDRSLVTSELIADMFETMYASNGVGLAAPQIGKNLRLFVIDAAAQAEAEEEPALADFKRTFINPHIYEWSEEESDLVEGCLSIPGIHETVWRPERIRIRYCDENWVEHDEAFDGKAARIIQHEYDHLEGKIFTDRVSPLRKALLRNKLTAMTKGKYSADYKTRLVK